MCYRTGKYTVFRRVCASFSPEMLQAGAVKGLILEDSSYTTNTNKHDYATNRYHKHEREREREREMDR